MNVVLESTSSHNPRADGQSGRVVGVVTTLLRIHCGCHMDNWVDQPGQLKFSSNTTRDEEQGKSNPFLDHRRFHAVCTFGLRCSECTAGNGRG